MAVIISVMVASFGAGWEGLAFSGWASWRRILKSWGFSFGVVSLGVAGGWCSVAGVLWCVLLLGVVRSGVIVWGAGLLRVGRGGVVAVVPYWMVSGGWVVGGGLFSLLVSSSVMVTGGWGGLWGSGVVLRLCWFVVVILCVLLRGESGGVVVGREACGVCGDWVAVSWSRCWGGDGDGGGGRLFTVRYVVGGGVLWVWVGCGGAMCVWVGRFGVVARRVCVLMRAFWWLGWFMLLVCWGCRGAWACVGRDVVTFVSCALWVACVAWVLVVCMVIFFVCWGRMAGVCVYVGNSVALGLWWVFVCVLCGCLWGWALCAACVGVGWACVAGCGWGWSVGLLGAVFVVGFRLRLALVLVVWRRGVGCRWGLERR